MPASFFPAACVPPEFGPDDVALVGVSGGRDSVALLHWLKSQGHHKLIACHLDHGLRAESGDDARFVKALCKDMDVQCVVGKSDVRALAKHRKQSLETAARHARLEFFAKQAKRFRTGLLFLAHHADDQAETFLFNLLRGAGVSGLGGMAPVAALGKLGVCRPLLGVWRDEIDAYCTAHKLKWVEDASNAGREFTRNRLRHDAIPALSRAMGRDVRRALWRAAEILRAENEVVSSALAAEPGDDLNVKALRALPLALQRRTIHAWLVFNGVPDAGFDEVEFVRSLLAGRVAKVNLPGNHHARRRAGRIFLEG